MWRLDSHWGALAINVSAVRRSGLTPPANSSNLLLICSRHKCSLKTWSLFPESTHARDDPGIYSLQLRQRLCGPEVTRQGRQRLQHVAHLTAGPVAELPLPYSDVPQRSLHIAHASRLESPIGVTLEVLLCHASGLWNNMTGCASGGSDGGLCLCSYTWKNPETNSSGGQSTPLLIYTEVSSVYREAWRWPHVHFSLKDSENIVVVFQRRWEKTSGTGLLDDSLKCSISHIINKHKAKHKFGERVCTQA